MVMGICEVDFGRIESFDAPCLEWLCHGNAEDVAFGNWISEIPGPDHLREMWGRQKIENKELRKALGGGDNFLDVVRVITPEVLAASIKGEDA